MQVKRFVADDMRTAMRIVKEEIGADAVILSNRVVNGKVEILAARDYDEFLINKALDKTLLESKPDSAAAYYERAAAERELQQAEHKTSGVAKNKTSSLHKKTAQKKPSLNTEHQAAGLYQSQAPLTNSMVEMRDELKSLRAMLENQHVLGEWTQLATKYPLRMTLYKRLTEMGLSQEVCRYLAKGLDNSADIEQAMQGALKQLIHQIPIADDDILNHGGVFAMVGPTGVGKTTTIAKLAARFAMQHGQRHVALISTDTYRIGAHEQLITYGRLLGVPVHAAKDTRQLQQLLHKLHDKKLILIDTAGMSQRDIEISQQLTHLSHPSSMIKPYLVLSANAQLSTLDEVINVFKKANPVACVLTKLDEAACLGSVLSAVIKHHLPVAFVSNGQKVPEDILPARARELVSETLAYSKKRKQSTDDEFMAVAFTSGMSHAPLT